MTRSQLSGDRELRISWLGRKELISIQATGTMNSAASRAASRVRTRLVPPGRRRRFRVPAVASPGATTAGVSTLIAPPCPRAAAGTAARRRRARSEEHTSELQSRQYLVCRLLLEKKKHD